MADEETIAPGIESTTSIIEQFHNTFTDLKSHEDASENMVQWKELAEYFLNLESLASKKSGELEEKAKMVGEKESETHRMIQEREAIVVAKEQDLVEQIQVLKDAAVAAIDEAREKNKPASPEPAIANDNAQNKVSSSVNGDHDANMPDQEESSPRSGVQAIAVQPRPELTQFCEQMDVKGLLNFITENEKEFSAIRKEIPVALKSATEPARLALDSLEGFYPPDENTSQDDNTNAALQGLRKSCVMLLESVSPLLVGAEADVDQTLNPETKQQAKAVADEWKSKMVEVGTDVASGNLLEAEAFLQLLSTFKIASEFDEEELYKLFLVIGRHKQTPELCRSLGLIDKVPGIVQTLIDAGRQIDAVHFVHAFELASSFPIVPLLKTYLKDLRRNCQGKGTNSGTGGLQIDVNAQELNALKAVIKCVEEYKLQPEYPLDPLQKRVSQLDKAKTDKKRPGEMVKHHHPKKARVNGGFYGRQMQMPVPAVDRRLPSAYGGEVGAYSGIAERYPQLGASYDYQGPSPGVYGQHDIAQRSYYYPEEERGPPPSHGGVASYGAPAPYGGAPSNYGAVSPYGNTPNYGSYTSSGGPHPSHPSYPSYI